MATYQSEFTGTQIDSAIDDILNGKLVENCKSWARGETGVRPGEDTDNAKYYAEQAAASAGAGSGVFSFNDRQGAVKPKEEDYSEFYRGKNEVTVSTFNGRHGEVLPQAGDYNLAQVGGSNPNLLLNPWFTVRQRGDGPFSAGTYGIDKWISVGSLSVQGGDGYVQISGTGWLDQLGLPKYIIGKEVTLSVMYASGSIESGSVTVPDAGDSERVPTSNGDLYISIQKGYPAFVLQPRAEALVQIKAVKLELGSVSTLANDIAPDYGTELAKCQRYLKMFSDYEEFRLVEATTDYIDFAIPVGTKMADNPRPIGDGWFINGQKAAAFGFVLSIAVNGSAMIRLRATKNNHGIPSPTLTTLGGAGISAEL